MLNRRIVRNALALGVGLVVASALLWFGRAQAGAGAKRTMRDIVAELDCTSAQIGSLNDAIDRYHESVISDTGPIGLGPAWFEEYRTRMFTRMIDQACSQGDAELASFLQFQRAAYLEPIDNPSRREPEAPIRWYKCPQCGTAFKRSACEIESVILEAVGVSGDGWTRAERFATPQRLDCPECDTPTAAPAVACVGPGCANVFIPSSETVGRLCVECGLTYWICGNPACRDAPDFVLSMADYVRQKDQAGKVACPRCGQRDTQRGLRCRFCGRHVLPVGHGDYPTTCPHCGVRMGH